MENKVWAIINQYQRGAAIESCYSPTSAFGRKEIWSKSWVADPDSDFIL